MTKRFLPLAALLLLAVAGCQTVDRAAGTNTSGAFPAQSDGMPGNPPGTVVSRTYDRVTGENTSGAYPRHVRRHRRFVRSHRRAHHRVHHRATTVRTAPAQ